MEQYFNERQNPQHRRNPLHFIYGMSKVVHRLKQSDGRAISQRKHSAADKIFGDKELADANWPKES